MVSPSREISFFTPICDPQNPILNAFERYFNWTGIIAQVADDIPPSNSGRVVKIVQEELSRWNVALKVISCFTLIIPLLVLLVKAVVHCKSAYTVMPADTQKIEEQVQELRQQTKEWLKQRCQEVRKIEEQAQNVLKQNRQGAQEIEAQAQGRAQQIEAQAQEQAQQTLKQAQEQAQQTLKQAQKMENEAQLRDSESKAVVEWANEYRKMLADRYQALTQGAKDADVKIFYDGAQEPVAFDFFALRIIPFFRKYQDWNKDLVIQVNLDKKNNLLNSFLTEKILLDFRYYVYNRILPAEFGAIGLYLWADYIANDELQNAIISARTNDIEFYQLSAERGNPLGQAYLGVCYKYGRGVEKNISEAVRLYQLSAAQGNSFGQSYLGFCYGHGRGVKQNISEAVRLYQLSAAQGNSFGQSYLGTCYEYGLGVEKNIPEAVRLYQLSAAQGNSHGQSNLGLCYKYGRGVEKNISKAVRLYQLSVEQGNSYGQVNLGICYEYGLGVEKDLLKAFNLYQLSAKQGNPISQRYLGQCYQVGIGTERDLEKARSWYIQAVEQGDEQAQTLLNNLIT